MIENQTKQQMVMELREFFFFFECVNPINKNNFNERGDYFW